MKWWFAKACRTFVLLGIFAIAMGFLEAIVVIYLRQIYFPQGFNFPLILLPSKILFVELIREIATIIMLVIIGIIAGNNYLHKFACFLYSFAVWDIFYYVGLKLFLNWPPSFLTWDVLFLIPVAWIAPVSAPLICSFTMMILAGSIVYFFERGYIVKIKLFEWGLILLGAFMIFCTFTWHYSKIIIQEGFLPSFWTLANNEHFLKIISQDQPTYFNWYLFALGEILILYALALMVKQTKSTFHRIEGE
jgi:hypothetical protein